MQPTDPICWNKIIFLSSTLDFYSILEINSTIETSVASSIFNHKLSSQLQKLRSLGFVCLFTCFSGVTLDFKSFVLGRHEISLDVLSPQEDKIMYYFLVVSSGFDVIKV